MWITGIVRSAAAEKEISALIDVFNWSSEYFSDQDVIIVGDYNADCSYFDEEEIKLPGKRVDVFEKKSQKLIKSKKSVILPKPKEIKKDYIT